MVAGPVSGIVTDLRLTRFRSHLDSRLQCERRTAVVVGPNGSGKTAVLEALSMLAPGRGLRGQADQDAMRRPDDVGWHVRAELAGADAPRVFEAEIRPGARRAVNVDGDRVSRMRLAEEIRVAWVTPAHDRLWTDPAEARRRFLDRLSAAFHPDHARASAGYAKSMRSRNLLLREERPDADWIASLELRMAEHGARLSANRAATLDRIRGTPGPDGSPFSACGLAVLGAEARASRDRGRESPGRVRDEVWTEDSLLRALRKGRETDLRAGRTLSGPHRSDLAGWLEDTGLPLRQASTGEQKGALIGIALACARAMAEDSRPAILLLDEVVAHLDESRREALLREIAGLGIQVWMTGVRAAAFAPLGSEAGWFSLTMAGGASRVVQGRPETGEE